jgi:hypothetical protein
VTGYGTEGTDVELEALASVVDSLSESSVDSGFDLLVDLEVTETVLEGFDEDVSDAGKYYFMLRSLMRGH